VTPRPKVLGGRLFLPPAVLEASLTPRQQVALLILRDHREGLTAHDLGQLVHEHLGVHHDGRPQCDWCSRTGAELAKSLKRAGHVTQHKGSVYRTVSALGGAADRPVDEPFDWKGFGEVG
jgi:hypothetical protein